MNLQELYNKLVKKDAIPPSRIAPVKSSLKRYALALGYPDLVSCPESAYNIAPEQYKQLIEEHPQRTTKSNKGSTTLSMRALTNIKHDIGFALREGASLGLIRGRYEPWNDKAATIAKPLYERGQSRRTFFQGETTCLPDITIIEKDLPPRLRKELDAYYEWSTKEFVPDRPRTRKRRPISADCDRQLLRRIAGFHVRFCGAVAEELRLESLTHLKPAAKYVDWFIEHHGRATVTLQRVLVTMISLADYLSIIAQSAGRRGVMVEASRRLKELVNRLPECVAVRDKQKCWLSLEEIEMCGINRYPRNAARIAAASETVRVKMHTLNPGKFQYTLKYTATHAFSSLLVRLLVRIPLRLRNFCEMCWNPHHPEQGKNLYRKDGSWYIRFSGSELKVGSRQGKIHSITHRVPAELNWLLEEVLTVWRPLITGVPYHFPVGDEAKTWNYSEPPKTAAPEYKRAPQDVHLFLASSCVPANRECIRNWVKSTTYAFTGVPVYPHLVRDIWATTYIKATHDIAGAAMRLGNTIEVTMKHYAHLLDEDAEASADAFNRELFGVETKAELYGGAKNKVIRRGKIIGRIAPTGKKPKRQS